MYEKINQNCRKFLSSSAAMIAALGLGIFGCNGKQTNTDAVQLSDQGKFPSLDGATIWLNSPLLTVAELNGKVVVVGIWTYTCINWLRQLPYVCAWADNYEDQGLVVIGVHSPEFEFEKNLDNVLCASQDLNVNYPIAVDSNYAIWRAFKN